MNLEILAELWQELRRYVASVDHAEAADTFVSVLIDNDINADDIKLVFKSDSEIKRAVASYLKDHQEDEDDEEDEDDYIDDDWSEEDDY